MYDCPFRPPHRISSRRGRKIGMRSSRCTSVWVPCAVASVCVPCAVTFVCVLRAAHLYGCLVLSHLHACLVLSHLCACLALSHLYACFALSQLYARFALLHLHGHLAPSAFYTTWLHISSTLPSYWGSFTCQACLLLSAGKV